MMPSISRSAHARRASGAARRLALGGADTEMRGEFVEKPRRRRAAAAAGVRTVVVVAAAFVVVVVVVVAAVAAAARAVAERELTRSVLKRQRRGGKVLRAVL